MKEIYEKIWGLARQHYKKGREMDIEHVEWMIHDALLVCKKERVDDSLLLPLVILHDVGYAGLEGNPLKKEMRETHMKAGTEIAYKILKKVNYPEEKIEQIVYYVSVHDAWALGETEIYENDKILGVFKDLDFIWVVTPKGFPAMLKLTGKSSEEFLTEIKAEARPAGKKGFSTETTKRLFKNYLEKLTSK